MKTKIKISLMLVFISMICSVSFAQKSGVFKSFNDYKIGKMEYEIDCATEKHKIKLNEFIGKDVITIIHNKQKYEMKKAEIFGFQLCDGIVVRFSGTNHFSAKDKGILWIYSKDVTELKSSGRSTKTETKTIYFFSKGGDGEIKPLTLDNIKSVYPENHKLHDSIDAKFKSNESLSEFDTFHKMYKINHFLESEGIK